MIKARKIKAVHPKKKEQRQHRNRAVESERAWWTNKNEMNKLPTWWILLKSARIGRLRRNLVTGTKNGSKLVSLLGFTEFLKGFNGFHWVLLGFTGFYRILLSFTGFYWVLLGFTGFYWVLLGLPITEQNIRLYWGFTGFHRGFTGFYWVLLGFTGFYWVLLGFTGFYLVYR